MRSKWKHFVMAGVIAVAIGVAACGDTEHGGSAPGGETRQTEVDIAEHPIEDPLLNTDKYVGQQVSVSSEVEAVLGAHAFTLAAPAGPFLVVSASQISDDEFIDRGAAVEVTGMVRDTFSISAFEQEFGVDVDDAVLDGFEDEAYVLADSVTQPPQSEDA